MRRFFVPMICAISVVPAASFAQPLSLQTRVDALVDAYEKQTGGTVGICIVDLVTGQKVVTRKEDRLFVPASNQKLLVSAAALAELGGDFNFTTTVFDLGEGRLLLRGDFDPTLGDEVLSDVTKRDRYEELDKWARAVKDALGDRPVAQVLVEDSSDPEHYKPPDWRDVKIDSWYTAPVSRLNYNNNCIDVTLTIKDARVTTKLFPVSRYIKINSAVKVGSKQLWALRGNKDDTAFTLRGTVAKSMPSPLPVPVTYPGLLLGRTFADRLARAGVAGTPSVKLVVPGSDAADTSSAKRLAETKTPLAWALRRADKNSLNMAAECILLRTGDGTWDGSASAVTQALIRHYGVDTGDLVVRDGSGLSHHNRVTPRAMAQVLTGALKRPDVAVLLRSMAVSGIDGTLSRRMGGSLRGRVYAKTGYVRRVCCLSGYVLDQQRRGRMAFAILANNFKGRAQGAKDLQDEICTLLAGYLDTAGRIEKK